LLPFHAARDSLFRRATFVRKMPTKSLSVRSALGVLFACAILLSFSSTSRGSELAHWSLNRTAAPAHVPEPMTLLLLGSVLVLAGRTIKRRSS